MPFDSGESLVIGFVGVAEIWSETYQRLSTSEVRFSLSPYLVNFFFASFSLGNKQLAIVVCRNYYRCSSSKGCSARKQVERSNEDPNMFVVTYCGDHTHPRPTHRNSLAGSTRTKAAFTTTSKLPESSPPVQLLPAAQGGGDDHDDEQGAANNNSGDGDKASEEAEDEEIEEDEEDEEFVVSSEEDIFLGMKQLGRTGSGGSTLGSLAAGVSSDGFSTKQSNLGSSWGAGCSSSAGATVSGGC